MSEFRLLLIGQVSSGKSSFYNTVNSIFRGYVTSQAITGNAGRSVTTMVRDLRKFVRIALAVMAFHALTVILSRILKI